MMTAGLERITDDLYGIARELCRIDERYVLYRNRKQGRFEIHADGALQLVVPYDRLDDRTLRLARRTRIERAKSVIDEIEKQNARLEEKKTRDIKDAYLAVKEETE